MTRYSQKCNPLPTTSMMGFADSNCSRPVSYCDFVKQHNSSKGHPYASPRPVQRFRQNYVPGCDKTAQWLNEHGRGYSGGSRANSAVSSCVSSPAQSVVSHVSRLSNISQLTVLTDFDSTTGAPFKFTQDGVENVDPRIVENFLYDLVTNHKTLLPDQQLSALRGVMVIARKEYSDHLGRRISQLARMVSEDTLKAFISFLLAKADEIAKKQHCEKAEYNLQRVIWKMLCYAARCNLCTFRILELSTEVNLLELILDGIRKLMPHRPYVVYVFKRLLESPFGSSFRENARIVESVDTLIAYMPHCDQLQSPDQSNVASGNKAEVVDCLRILMNSASIRVNGAQKKSLQVVRDRFVLVGGVQRLIDILKSTVEEPILNATTGALNSVLRGNSAQNTAEQIIAGGAVQLLASRLGHASPAVVLHCLKCLAAVSDLKEALRKLGAAMNGVVAQVINVIGTTNIAADENASGFIFNIATIPEFKEFLISNGAVRILLKVIYQHACSFFAPTAEIDRSLHKMYIETLENSIRALAHLSSGDARNPDAELVVSQLCAFDRLLIMLTNLLKAFNPRSGATFRRREYISQENSYFVRRNILLILERNLQHLAFRNLFKADVEEHSFGDAQLYFPEAAFDLLYDVNEQWIKTENSVFQKRMEGILKTLVALAKFAELANGFAWYFQNEDFLRFFESLRHRAEPIQQLCVDLQMAVNAH